MKTTHIVPYRRKRAGRTNYRKRLALLKSGSARFIVRKSSTKIIAQVGTFAPQGDKILVSVDSSKLASFGWKGPAKNLSAAYLTGLLAGKEAMKKGVKDAILDTGMITNTKGSRIFAALKGFKDAGVDIHTGEEILPPEDRINGKHVATYAADLAKGDKATYDKQFSQYIKAGTKPEELDKQFEAVKSKIMSN